MPELLARRIIPCLDVRDGRVVKGVRFRDHRDAGDIVELASRYRAEGADELVIYDISASPEGRSLDREWVSRVARELDIPFSVAGGIRSVADAEVLLAAGAEKVSINSPALDQPTLITDLASRFGSQCVVVGIDSASTATGNIVWQFTGDPNRAFSTGRHSEDWIREVQERGAGEVVVNCMNNDGVRKGYDINHLSSLRDVCSVPLIASGGAGQMVDFVDVFKFARADGALAASVFHSGEVKINDLKTFLLNEGIEIRP